MKSEGPAPKSSGSLARILLMPIEEKIQNDIPLAPLTTWKVGGPAKYFIEIADKEDLTSVFDWQRAKRIKYFILAGGSNVLVDDNGFDGLVIRIKNNKIAVKGGRIQAGAGALLQQAVSRAVGASLSGLEWATGIPGTVGGAVRGNAGAFGRDMAGSLETVEAYNIRENAFLTMSRSDCRFGYRDSIFKASQDLLAWQAVLVLHAGNSDEINRQMQNNWRQRSGSQPRLPSAGCVFKNLRIDELQAANPELAETARKQGIVKADKVAAGWLISRLDLAGKRIGGAKISLEHCNFIVNASRAKAQDIVMLISEVKQKARDEFGVQLSEEIQYIN